MRFVSFIFTYNYTSRCICYLPCPRWKKAVHSNPQALAMGIFIIPRYPDSPDSESSHVWKYIGFGKIWNKYAMDGYIACANVYLKDMDGGQ